MKDIFGTDIISEINLNKKFIGTVITSKKPENKEDYPMVKVYIQELEPSFSSLENSFTTSEGIYNDGEFLEVTLDNGIWCRYCPFIQEGNYMLPKEKTKVMIEFLNGDIKQGIVYPFMF